MRSVGEAALALDRTEPWVRSWIKKRKLGRKCGWAIILSDEDYQELLRIKNGNKESVAQNAATNHAAVQQGDQERHSPDAREVARI